MQELWFRAIFLRPYEASSVRLLDVLIYSPRIRLRSIRPRHGRRSRGGTTESVIGPILYHVGYTRVPTAPALASM